LAADVIKVNDVYDATVDADVNINNTTTTNTTSTSNAYSSNSTTPDKNKGRGRGKSKTVVDERTIKYLVSHGKVSSSSPAHVSRLNSMRREYYSMAELVKMDAEEYIDRIRAAADNVILNMIRSNPKDDIDKSVALIKEIEHINKALKLQAMPLRWGGGLFARGEALYRGITLGTAFVIAGIFGSMLILSLKVVDSICGISERRYSDRVRQGIAHFILTVLGIKVEVRGDTYNCNKGNIFAESGCHLLTFTHASNLDGFIVSATVPINHIALAKKELFLIPFFSWIALAFGGTPVDRENRDRAIAALKTATDAATKDDNGLKTAIVIAPEGTRSTSGQLLDFKKGAFHIWDEIRCPIVPFVTIGAFDLYPPGSMFNRPGKVYATYLPAIKPSDASSREDMMRLVRRRVLEHLAQPSPDDLCSDITTSERITSWSIGLGTIVFDYTVFKAAHYVLLTYYDLSILTVALGGFLATIAVTVALYVYFVYLVALGKPSGKMKTSISSTWRDSNGTNKDD